MTKGSRLSVALLSALLITGCAARGVRIADLQDRPDKYEDKTVAVNDVVTTSWGIPLVPFQLYKVDDGTGEITVLARSGRAPRKGARVEVKGRLNEIGSFGGQSVGLHIEAVDVCGPTKKWRRLYVRETEAQMRQMHEAWLSHARPLLERVREMKQGGRPVERTEELAAVLLRRYMKLKLSGTLDLT